MKIRSLFFHGILCGLLSWGLVEFLKLTPLTAWLASVNTILFLAMGRDKAAAKAGMGRVPEATLFGMALAGGFPGMFAARKVFNHKTTKPSFVLTMWILFALQLAASTWYVGGLEGFGFKKKDLSATTTQKTVTAGTPADTAQKP